MSVSVLFARSDSIYKTLCSDVWDSERDAMLWPGGNPVVAHPPCRSWGRLRWAAKPQRGERELAIRAVEMVRVWGGVLEHPAHSRLWAELPLPKPGKDTDRWGGFSLSVEQKWWGHSCDKATWLYVCGIARADVPSFPMTFLESTKVVTSSLYRKGNPRWKPHCTKAEREQSPIDFARWLLLLAERAASRP